MSDRYLDLRRESAHGGNYIPLGRQLHRTPPMPDVKRHLDFCSSDPDLDCENVETDIRAQDDGELNGTFDFSTVRTKTEPEDHSMLKGMTGYQLTASDLDFIKKMQEEKLVKKLQADLEEVQRLLKRETMAAELAHASRERAQAELKQLPSCEELAEWAKVVLDATAALPPAEEAGEDAKALLSLVTKGAVQRVMNEKRSELARMEKMAANKRKKEAKAEEQLEKEVAGKQLKMQGLMSQLCRLKSELAQEQETFKALQTQISNQESPQIKEEPPEEAGAGKSHVKGRGMGRKKAEKVENTNRGKPARRKDAAVKTEDPISAKDAEKPTKAAKAARGPQRKEPDPPDQPARGRRKPAGAAAAVQPKRQSKEEGSGGDASQGREEALNAGLRRSKRIASRR